MRKLIAIAALAAVMTALTGGTAGALTVTKFSGLTLARGRDDFGRHSFVYHGRLVRLHHHQDVIAHWRARVHYGHRGHEGEVFFFPDGKLKASGTQDHLHHWKIPIVGGTGAWNGASGKIKFRFALLHFTVIRAR